MLIQWLREHSSKDRVIHNAAHTGRIENYGVFCSAPASTCAGWVLRITTPQAKYFVAVVENEMHEWVRWYRIRPEQIDWTAWSGGQFQSELYRGDQSELYDDCRQSAITPQELSRPDPAKADSDVPSQADGRPGDTDADRPVDRNRRDPTYPST
jgi:hypothetical protein